MPLDYNRDTGRAGFRSTTPDYLRELEFALDATWFGAAYMYNVHIKLRAQLILSGAFLDGNSFPEHSLAIFVALFYPRFL